MSTMKKVDVEVTASGHLVATLENHRGRVSLDARNVFMNTQGELLIGDGSNLRRASSDEDAALAGAIWSARTN